MNSQLPLSFANLPAKKDFTHYYVSEANRDTVESVRQCRDKLLFIHGALGTGRTHLLQAACRQMEMGRAAYLPLQDLSAWNPHRVLDRLDMYQLLCLDDLSSVIHHSHWQEALLILLKLCSDSDISIIMASDTPPQKMNIQLAELSARFNGGLVLELHPLNDSDKVNMLCRMATLEGFSLPPSVADYILRRAPRDMATLVEVLHQLDWQSLADKRRVTIPFVRQVMHDMRE